VFGTSLIRGDLLKEGRSASSTSMAACRLNIAADCTFWALYNGEPEKVGCTLHYIDAGIDTGRLMPTSARKCARVTASWCCSGAQCG